MRILIPILLLTAFACTEIKPVKLENVAVNSGIPSDPEVEAMIEPYRDSLNERMNKVIGTVGVDMSNTRDSIETLLGNFVADLSYQYIEEICIREEIMFCPDMAIMNFGGLRTSIGKGDFTVGDAYELMPFENYIVAVELDSTKMRVLMRYLAEHAQPISRAQLYVSNGDTTFTVYGKPLRDRTYYVVTTDYLANGGDQMEFFKDQKIHFFALLRDVIIQHVESLDKPISPEKSDRIKYE